MSDVPSEFPESQTGIEISQPQVRYPPNIMDDDDLVSITAKGTVEADEYVNPNPPIKVDELQSGGLTKIFSKSDYLQILDETGKIDPMAQTVLITFDYQVQVHLPSLNSFEFEENAGKLMNYHTITLINTRNDVWHTLHSDSDSDKINSELSQILIQRGAKLQLVATEKGWYIY